MVACSQTQWRTMALGWLRWQPGTGRAIVLGTRRHASRVRIRSAATPRFLNSYFPTEDVSFRSDTGHYPPRAPSSGACVWAVFPSHSARQAEDSRPLASRDPSSTQPRTLQREPTPSSSPPSAATAVRAPQADWGRQGRGCPVEARPSRWIRDGAVLRSRRSAPSIHAHELPASPLCGARLDRSPA